MMNIFVHGKFFKIIILIIIIIIIVSMATTTTATQQYIGYAKLFAHPVLSRQAAQVLQVCCVVGDVVVEVVSSVVDVISGVVYVISGVVFVFDVVGVVKFFVNFVDVLGVLVVDLI